VPVQASRGPEIAVLSIQRLTTGTRSPEGLPSTTFLLRKEKKRGPLG
jgi:hypothetical protein